MPDLLSLGECMIEFFSEEPLETATCFRRSFGGDAFNLLAAARRLGTSAGFVTRIAPDAFGAYLLRNWEREGIDTRFVRREGAFNGVYFIATGENGEREFTYYRKGGAASGLQPADLDGVDFREIGAFHASGITQALSPSARETALEGLWRASQAGCLTSYDLNYRARLWSPEEAKDALGETLPFVNVCFAGVPEDTEPLFDSSDPEQIADQLHESGVSIVVLKRGVQGAVVSSAGKRFRIPSRIYGLALDTTGAGDAFAGAFLHGLLEGGSPEDAGHLGAACAGLKVLGRGAVASMPTGELIRLRLAEGISPPEGA
jgi:2-dehydro-3-deoxygluconokinase